MQLSSGITYENVSDIWTFSSKRTYSPGITVSGRLQNWYDVDGSASLLGVRSMIGSMWSEEWWKYNSGCEAYLDQWRCRLAAEDSAASVLVKHNAALEAGIGSSVCINGGGSKPCPVVGTVSHWGVNDASKGLKIGINAKLSGPLIASSGGWFIRFDAGTPKNLKFTNIQVMDYVKDIFIVAIPYPAGTSFTIYHKGADWCATSNECRHNYRKVNTLAEVISSFGDAYFWNSGTRTLYLRLIQTNQHFGKKGTDPAIWTSPIEPDEQFSRGKDDRISVSLNFSFF